MNNETIEHYLKIRNEYITFSLKKSDINLINQLIEIYMNLPSEFSDLSKKIELANLQIEIFKKCKNFSDEEIEKITGRNPQEYKELLKKVEQIEIEQIKQNQ